MIKQVKAMKFWKQTLPFLVLNVLVSAATMLAVLFFWQPKNPFRPAEPTQPIITPIQGAASLPAATSTVPAAEGQQLYLEGVFGVGDIKVEYILLRNRSTTAVDLTGWRLRADGGREYRFPNLTLNPNGAVRIYSGLGTNSVIELYWNSDSALWASGDQLTLLNRTGDEHTQFVVP